MFRFRNVAAGVGLLMILAPGSLPAATLEPLTSFGSMFAGWRAPFEVLPGDAAGTDSIQPGMYNYLGDAVNFTTVNAGNLERGLAYNPTTGHLILASRNNAGGTLPSIRILDGMTGVDIGALNEGSGIIAGGTFAFNMVAVAEDGAIYIGNLTTNVTDSGSPGPFKIYRWESESAAAPTLAYSGAAPPGVRLGDTLDAIGTGADTRLVAGHHRLGTVASNAFTMFATADGLNFTATPISLSAAPEATLPPNGEFGLGITFTDSDTVIGTGINNPANIVDVNVSAGTGLVTVNMATEGATLRPMDFAVVAGKPLLAMIEASPDQTATARARIFVYDMTDPTLPLAERKIGEATNLPLLSETGPNQFANINGTGQVKFGAIQENTAIIYAMSTNNGIQAFLLTLDPLVGNDGDYNGDGIVNAADYVVWRRDDGSQEGYDAWRMNFGMTVPGGGNGIAPVAVPEPGAWALLVLASSHLAWFVRRR